MGLLTLRVLTLIVAAFSPFSGPHEWRQYDTIGMGYRYFIEFFQSQIDKYPKILPAVLQAGDKLGVTPVELPILNLFVSPLFIFGETTGQVLANLFLLIINIQLTYQCYLLWKDTEVLDKKVGEAFLLIPLVSFSMIYFGKFIPDMLSVLLALYALGLAVKCNKLLQASLFASIALLMKPTSVIVYAFFLLLPERKVLKHYLWMGFSILITILYYKQVNPAILEFAGEKSIFAVGTKPLTVAIQQFLDQPGLYFSIFLKSLFGNWLILPFVALLGFNLLRGKTKLARITPFIGIILLQSLFLHLLSGNHPYWHNYYYLGIAPIACLFLWQEINTNAFTARSFQALLLVMIVLQSVYDLKPLVKPHKKRPWQIRSECLELKEHATDFPWDKGYHFRSSIEHYPTLGMCFGEIQNAAKTEYGFFYKDKRIPNDCQEIKSSKHLILAKCN
jgi:hypothetical protein